MGGDRARGAGGWYVTTRRHRFRPAVAARTVQWLMARAAAEQRAGARFAGKPRAQALGPDVAAWGRPTRTRRALGAPEGRARPRLPANAVESPTKCACAGPPASEPGLFMEDRHRRLRRRTVAGRARRDRAN